MSETYLFVGPTAYGLPDGLLEQPGLARCAPVQRGDVLALISHAGAPGRLVIVDGRFGDVMAVGHREIVTALDVGWQVWGLASMGAVRACELSGEGMLGYGEVYEHFATTDAPDDEVAVLHGPAPEYRPITEALVDLRAVLQHLVAIGGIAARSAQRIEGRLAESWFGDRSLAALVRLCAEVEGRQGELSALRAVRCIGEHRIKSRDLRTFLQEGPWHDRL